MVGWARKSDNLRATLMFNIWLMLHCVNGECQYFKQFTEYGKQNQCAIFSAPVNCQWSNWTAWGSCSESCDGGTQTSTRSKTVWETNGGTCSGSSERSRSCNSQSCPGEISFTYFFSSSVLPGNII